MRIELYLTEKAMRAAGGATMLDADLSGGRLAPSEPPGRIGSHLDEDRVRGPPGSSQTYI